MNKLTCILLSYAILYFGYTQPVRANAASQFPVVTRDGGTNITHIWLHKGGGRLYWNTLVYPLQIRLEGAHFVDPASVPELVVTPPPRKRHTPARRSGRHRPQRTAQAPKEAVQPAPMDAGQTALRPPSQATSSAKPATASSQKATPRRPAISSTTDRAAPPPVTTFTDLR